MELRLKQLADAFKEAGYPFKMVTEITNKVKSQLRNIEVQTKQQKDCDQVLVVSTYEADQKLVKAVRDSEEVFKQTQSFRN